MSLRRQTAATCVEVPPRLNNYIHGHGQGSIGSRDVNVSARRFKCDSFVHRPDIHR